MLPILILILLSIPFKILAQNETSLISEKMFRILNNEVSGEIAQDYIRYITHFDRLQPSKSYHESAKWVVEAAKKAGLVDAHIEEYPSDGKKRYYMHDTELAWDVDFAELWIVEPYEEKLTSYAEIPMSIAITSDPCDVTAEMIFVGVGTSSDDYEGINVKGKIVFAEGSIG